MSQGAMRIYFLLAKVLMKLSIKYDPLGGKQDEGTGVRCTRWVIDMKVIFVKGCDDCPFFVEGNADGHPDMCMHPALADEMEHAEMIDNCRPDCPLPEQ